MSQRDLLVKPDIRSVPAPSSKLYGLPATSTRRSIFPHAQVCIQVVSSGKRLILLIRFFLIISGMGVGGSEDDHSESERRMNVLYCQ